MPCVSRAPRGHEPGAARIDRKLLGRIVVARTLDLPPRAFERHVRGLEQSPHFRKLRDVVRPHSLSGLPARAVSARGYRLLGAVEDSEKGLVLRYASPAFDRVYEFDDVTVAERAAENRALARLLGRLRLVNTRNRLTHALARALLDAQTDYLRSGDPLRLCPLSQAALARRLRASGTCPVDADPSRLSRLLRCLAVCRPDGEAILLKTLCPTTRSLHRHYIGHILKREQAALMEDDALAPMTDREIARAALCEFGVRLLTRTVSYVRRDLGIPAARERRHRSKYLSATVGFSPVLPLREEVLRERVPPGPGVYELRCDRAAPDSCSIIYLGSARDLPKRLMEHLRGYSDNTLLQQFVEGGARFRYLRVADDWRGAERAIYRAFRATFDRPPACNRLSP